MTVDSRQRAPVAANADQDDPVVDARTRLGAVGIAAGCVWFGIMAISRPTDVARRCGVSVEVLRAMAMRDLGSAVTLAATRDPRAALLARVVFDASDAVLLARRRPTMAAVTIGFGALSGALLAREHRRGGVR